MAVYHINRYMFLEDFACLGGDCEDTCCRGWGMQVDKKTADLYEKEAPELLDFITFSGESGCIMKRDPESDYCLKYDKGWCKIHSEKSDRFLGDACNFFPRITRGFGNKTLMSASLSCPEIVRKVLAADSPFSIQEANVDRLPYSIKDYLPNSISSDAAIEIINSLVGMVDDEEITAERAMARIVVIAQSLQTFEEEKWLEVVPFLIKMADSRLMPPEEDKNDPYFLIQTLRALIHAIGKPPLSRLAEVFAQMEKVLGATINPDTLDVMVNVGQEDFPQQMRDKWVKAANTNTDKVLKRWLQSQLVEASFPFAGFGDNIYDCAVILAVRFATIKLALMSHIDDGGCVPNEDDIVRIIQSLSRFMDHLAEPELSMNLYEQAGWAKDSRLRSLIADV